MAKQVYPIVKDYIDSNKPIDKNFITQYLEQFDKNFSDWLTTMDFIMRGRYVLSENPADFNLIDRTYYSNHENQNEISQSSIEKMKTHPTTKIIIVNKNNKKQLDLVKNSFEELIEWQPDADNDFSYAVFLKDKTYLLILNNVKGATEEKLKSITIKQD